MSIKTIYVVSLYIGFFCLLSVLCQALSVCGIHKVWRWPCYMVSYRIHIVFNFTTALTNYYMNPDIKFIPCITGREFACAVAS